MRSDVPKVDTDPLREASSRFPDEPALTAPHGAFSRTVRILDCGRLEGCSGVQSPGVRQVSVTVGYPAAPAGAGPAHRGAVVLTTYIGPR